MRFSRLGPAILLAALVLHSPLRATTTEEVKVTCPVCANEFLADEWASTNNVGGYDRDFLKHAAGGQVFIISCWTCPQCRYTGFPSGFKADKAPKQLIERLKKENPLRPAEPIDPKLEHSRKIPAWVRYDLLIQVLKLQREVEPGRLAFVHLRTAQTQRFGWTSLERFETRREVLWKKVWASIPKDTRGYDREIACARQYEKLAQDATSDLADENRPLAVVLAAVQYKSRGEDPDAARAISSLTGKKLEPGLQEVVEDINARIAREKVYLKRAVPYLEAQAAEKGRDEKEVTNLRYLLGVIHRKLGENEKALGLLEPLLEIDGIPEGLRAWVQDEIAKTKGG